jgi:flagellar biosynthetic protein FliO
MDFVQQLAGVVLVFALLGVLVWYAKGRSFALPIRFTRPRRMEILERLALSPQHSLHLINVDGRTILIGVSPGSCQLLDELKDGK